MFLDVSLGVLASLHGFDAYWVLFLLVAGAGIGGPWSQDILLLAAGSVLAPDAMHPAAVIAAGWLGVMAGDAFSLWVGRYYGTRWVRRRFAPPCRPGRVICLLAVVLARASVSACTLHAVHHGPLLYAAPSSCWFGNEQPRAAIGRGVYGMCGFRCRGCPVSSCARR